MSNLIAELRWRGLLHDITPGTEEQLLKESTTGYVGFDPTADSLHVGSLVPILLLVHMQRAGHKPIALIGGATGAIGDPSGKSEERNLLSEDQLQTNIRGIRAQLERFLDFTPGRPGAAELVNNADWFRGLGFIDFLRDVGKHITVNYMLAKESVKKRIEGDTGISYTEFAYQLMQGYDFYWLYQNKGCKLQFGGSDQWGNMTTGSELIRKKGGGEAFVLTNPLITKSDGAKFGKTEKGNVWLDAERTSPYQFYQFWLNASDEDAEKWIRIFTFLPQAEIEAITETHNRDRGQRTLQKALGEDLTVFVHGPEGLAQANATTERLFAQAFAPASALSIEDLEGMEGVERKRVSRGDLDAGMDAVSLLAATGIFPSKGEARKMIQGGGVSINREKWMDAAALLTSEHLLHGKYLLAQKGKKNYYLLEAE